jgi:predicted Zn-ribbon and HTH transcriptional regulator
MGMYFRNDAMETGKFRCQCCGYVLADELVGSNYRVAFRCNRCKTRTMIECPFEIPFVVAKTKETVAPA